MLRGEADKCMSDLIRNGHSGAVFRLGQYRRYAAVERELDQHAGSRGNRLFHGVEDIFGRQCSSSPAMMNRKL